MAGFDWRQITDRLREGVGNAAGTAAEAVGDVAGAAKSGAGTALGAAKDYGPTAAAAWFAPVPLAAYKGLQHLGGVGGGGGSETPAGAEGTPTPTPTPTPSLSDGSYTGFHPFMNPLAMSGFFSQSIAPFLNQISQNLGAQSAQWQNQAQANMGRFQMPAQFKAYFGQALPQMAQDQSNVQAALMGAAATAPMYETMMKNVGNLQKQAQDIYSIQAARKAVKDLETAGIFSGQGVNKDVENL
jgi:hypothetical protein